MPGERDDPRGGRGDTGGGDGESRDGGGDGESRDGGGTNYGGGDTGDETSEHHVSGESRRENGGSGGFSLSLPPIRLPPLFPEDFRILWPAPGETPRRRVSARAVAAALVAFDAVDAVLALSVDAGVVTAVRVAAGVAVAASALGALGALYAWEAAAALLGFGELTAVPTLALLLVARALR